MTHAYHDALPGYNPEHILHDGCPECEHRGNELRFGELDGGNFERAWERVIAWNTDSGTVHVSRAEMPMFNCLWSIILHLERRGIASDVCPGTSYADQRALLSALYATD